MAGGVPFNIAQTLRETAHRFPELRGVVAPARCDWLGRVGYVQLTFWQLERESDYLAAGLVELGVRPGDRIVLAVRPSIEFITLTFALFKAGAVIVLIDPGMGTKRLLDCLQQVDPDGFVGLPLVQFARRIHSKRFQRARFNVTVARRRYTGNLTYRELLESGARCMGISSTNAGPNQSGANDLFAVTGDRQFILPATRSTDPAAIIFTSGSTGPPKGVVYEHGMFGAQVDALRSFYRIEPGGVDVPGFPLFGLFNAAMGVTTVIPQMDAARPASVDPQKFLAGLLDQGATQSFGSPAIWKRVGGYCAERGIKLPTLKRVFSAGAPVPDRVLEQVSATFTSEVADMHTPYGATEALPVASISAREVLGETCIATRRGAGTCVGHPFPNIEVRVIEITDSPILDWSQVRQLPIGEIGELVVRGPVVTREYYHLPDATAAAKIADSDSFWHRMGDVGYLDDTGRIWFCGRKSQRVQTVSGPLYTDQVEPVFNQHPQVARSALVGVGNRPEQRPVVVLELHEGTWSKSLENELRDLAAATSTTRRLNDFRVYPGQLPVDVRHNTKINREQLAAWAAQQK